MVSEMIEDLRRFRQNQSMTEEQFSAYLRFKHEFCPEYFSGAPSVDQPSPSKADGKAKRGRKAKSAEAEQMNLVGTSATQQ